MNALSHLAESLSRELGPHDFAGHLVLDAVLSNLNWLAETGRLRLADSIDPIAVARRVLASPEREAVRVSTLEITAMSIALVALHGPIDDPVPALELNHAVSAA